MHVETTGSTNADLSLRANLGEDIPDGYVLLADTQTAGKGRQGRSWCSPPGTGLYFSIFLRPAISPLQASTLPLVIGYAVAEAVQKYVPNNKVSIKWPNDLQINGRKLCGILCEMRAEGENVKHIIAGIGINVNLSVSDLPQETAAIATSLRIVSNRQQKREEVFADILNSIENNYLRWLADGFESFLPGISARNALQGKAITIDRNPIPPASRTGADKPSTVSGTVTGIGPDGALILRLPNGTTEMIYSGDAHIIK